MKTLIKELFTHDSEQWYSLQDAEGNTKMQKQKNGQALVLEDNILDEHLVGNLTICLQPIQFGSNKTKYGVVDIDADDSSQDKLQLALDTALNLVEAANRYKIPAYISFSGRRGWHVYVFAEKSMPAGIMRKALMALSKEAGYKAKEIYPSSDYLSQTYYPRPIKLTPGKHKLGSWAGFVIPDNIQWENGKPRLPHQLKIMERIRKADVFKLLELSQQVEDRPEYNFKNIVVDWDSLSDQHPPCINYLATKGAPPSLDYNRANMTLARYGLNRQLPENTIRELGRKMAEATVNHPSSKDTVEKRIHNLHSSMWSMRKKAEKRVWVCSYIKAVPELRPLCSHCNINASQKPSAASKDVSLTQEEQSFNNEVLVKPLLPCPEFLFVQSMTEVAVVLTVLDRYNFIGLDFDFDDKGMLVFVGVSTHHGKTYIFDMAGIGDISFLSGILESESVIKIMFDCKPAVKYLLKHGIVLGNVMDIMLLGHLIMAGEERIIHELEDFVQVFMGYSLPNRKENQASFESIFSTKCQAILQLSQTLYNNAERNGLLQTAMLECACVKTLAGMELNGIKLADKKLTYIAAEIKAKLKTLRDSLQKALSDGLDPIDLNSPAVIKTALAKKGIKVPNTKEPTLRPLAKKNQVVRDIIEYRHLQTMEKTYSTNLLKHIDPNTQRIHTTFKQTAASTGRMSSEQPCTMNWPQGNFRELIIAEPGNVLVAGDYNQIQMVILAEISQDQKLLQIFRTGQDVHVVTASNLLGKPVANITSEERQKIKAINYGLVFDMTPTGLSQYAKTRYNVNMTIDEAEVYRTNYFEIYQGVRDWKERIKKESLDTRCSRTLSNRRRLFTTRVYTITTSDAEKTNKLIARYMVSHEVKDGFVIVNIPEFYSNDVEFILSNQGYAYSWSYAEPRDSQLYNTPVQGTEADILKLALVNTAKAIIAPYPAMIINAAHDEIVLECKKNVADNVVKVLEQEMVRAAVNWLRLVPVKVDVKVGPNWRMKKQ